MQKLTATYDALDRLVSATTTPSLTTMSELALMTETYAYNAIGNLTGRYGVSATGQITYPAAGSARPHAATGAGLNSYVYDANGNMTVRREVSGTDTFVYTQTWSIDNRLIGVTKALTNGVVLAQTSYFYDGDGVRVRKDDPDGTALYAGPVEQTIGPGGTATAEYFDDISGTSTLTAFVATRNETVTAGFQQTFTVPPTGLGSEPWGVRYQIWLTVPTTDTYRLAVYADDGFLLSGQGLSLSNATTRDVTTTEASTVLTLTPGAIYNFALTYLNYTSATTSALQILWRRGGGALEVVPKEAIRARGRRDYYSFGGAVVAMKEGVMASVTRTLSYLHGDHLGSASLTTNASGQKVSEQRYKPYGEVRWSNGAGMPTDKQFTGQTRLAEGYVGTLYDYVARAYDPVLGRFISADTIVPRAGNSQAFNRYMYVRGNPLKFTDPTGHVDACGDDCAHAEGYSSGTSPRYACAGQLGCFDIHHMGNFPSNGNQSVLWRQFQEAATRNSNTGKSWTFPIPQSTLGGGFSLGAEYEISANLPKDQWAGVMMGIYLDYANEYERRQYVGSGYANQDLPSDYVGMNAAIRGVNPVRFFKSLATISGETISWHQSETPPTPWVNWLDPARNYEPTPRIYSAPFEKGSKWGASQRHSWRNLPWPEEVASLLVTSIGADAGLWRRTSLDHRLLFIPLP